MIYSRIVEKKVRAVFAQINLGNYMEMVNGLGDPFTYRFHGEHALGGERTSRAAMIQWWQRVMKLLPGAQFSIHDVIVRGTPWHTRIAVRASVHGELPNDAHYQNTVMQFMTVRWGKVTEVETIEDLHVLQHALDIVAANGNPEATAAPIVG